ncbi:MAG: DUF5131 family protein [Caulobacter sp.]|nr:DUF5131 family protein [Caulobacter sp.]
MADVTSISWTDHTFAPWFGCTKVSPACDGCYAEHLTATRFGKAKWGPHAERVRSAASTWKKPLTWNRAAARDGTSSFVFCSHLSDVFDNQVPPEWRAELFDLIRITPNLTWLLLTKRPQNIVKLFAQSLARPADDPDLRNHWPRNAAVGCTVVTQAEADRDVPILLKSKLQISPAFAFVSMEPLLEAVGLTRVCLRPRVAGSPRAGIHLNSLTGRYFESGVPYHGDWDINGPAPTGPGLALDWVITGGETDQGKHMARPSHPDWFRSLRDQCAAAGVAYHHKQNGEWAPVAIVDPDGIVRGDDIMIWPNGHIGGGTHHQHGGYGSLQRKVGVGRAGRELDGVIHDARPATQGAA